MVKIPDTTTFNPTMLTVPNTFTMQISQPPNPWQGIAKIAKRVGVEPTKRSSVGVVIDAGNGEYYDAFEVIEGVLDYIDRKTKDE